MNRSGTPRSPASRCRPPLRRCRPAPAASSLPRRRPRASRASSAFGRSNPADRAGSGRSPHGTGWPTRRRLFRRHTGCTRHYPPAAVARHASRPPAGNGCPAAASARMPAPRPRTASGYRSPPPCAGRCGTPPGPSRSRLRPSWCWYRRPAVRRESSRDSWASGSIRPPALNTNRLPTGTRSIRPPGTTPSSR